MTSIAQPINLLDLPVEMVDKILSYLTYDQIAKLRGVNKMFNMICSDKLNKGFTFVNQYQHRCLKAIKAKLPRRESERRHHPLGRHVDMLMAVETRLSMLSMTFCKYIDSRQCCFIPGKVLDEALKVLRSVSNGSVLLQPSTAVSPQYSVLPRPHVFLQEYRDVSSMAMEHFDEKILPRIREKMDLENPKCCFKPKPSIFFSGHGSDMALDVKNILQQEPVASTSAKGNGSTDGNAQKKRKLDPVVEVMHSALRKVCSSVIISKHKIKAVSESVVKLERVVKRMKLENGMLKRQMVRQKVVTKHLRRELREARAAMSVMSKDLNEIKLDVSSSQPRGTKRRREECD